MRRRLPDAEILFTQYRRKVRHHSNGLAHLLGNAVKFTETGTVTLRAKTLEDFGNTTLLRFEVHDTGIGIPKEKQAAIFEPFTQADDSITRKYGGTGLGTTIARHLVGLMGGKIGVESEEGIGTTFAITFPVHNSQIKQEVPNV